MKAMIFAAGLGTRLQPLTDKKPKALIEINGMTMLEIVIKRLIYFGFNEIIINVHHFSEQIIEFLKQKNNFGITIAVSDETKSLLDTGGGLKKTSWFFNDGKPFLVHNVDILSNIDLRKLYEKHIYSDALATLAVSNKESSRYLLFNSDNNLCGWKNIKTNKTIVVNSGKENLLSFGFCGIHIINTEIFKLINEKGKFSIIDVYLRLAKKYRISGFNTNDSIWLDIGTKGNLLKAKKMLKKSQLNNKINY